MKTLLKKFSCTAAAAILICGVFSPAVYGLRVYDESTQDYPDFSAYAHETQTENTVIVKTDGTLPDFRALHPDYTVQGPDDTYVVAFADAQTAAEKLPQMETLHGVEYAEPNGIVVAQSDGTAWTEYQTWGMEFMQAESFAERLSAQEDLQSVILAVVDSGIKADEPVFKDRLVEGTSFLDSPYTQDDFGHGTSVAGVAADCTQNLPVMLMPIKVLRGNGTGTLLDAANGIKYAADNGAAVINLSFVSENCSQTLHDAIDYACERNSLPVISAGNYAWNMDNHDCCPADYAPGFVVSGCDRAGNLYTGTCYGSTVDLCAPADSVPCTTIYGTPATLNGTSFAAPHIAALAAMYKLYMPLADRAALEKMLILNTKDLGNPGFDVKYGNGVPDLSALDGSLHPDANRVITDLQIQRLPNQTTYYYKDTFSADGLLLRVQYSDGTQELRSTQGVRISGADSLRRGRQQIQVRFDDHETSFEILVKYKWWQWLIHILLFGWIWY